VRLPRTVAQSGQFSKAFTLMTFPGLICEPAREQEMALETEIAAYERLHDELEKHHQGKFVVFHGEDFIGSFDTLDNAAAEAVRRFGRGPYLIRQVGRPPITLPASVLYRPVADVADR
jgi:hypothetical protein